MSDKVYPLDEYSFDRIFDDMTSIIGGIIRTKRKIYARFKEITDEDIHNIDMNIETDISMHAESWENREINREFKLLDVIANIMCLDDNKKLFWDEDYPDFEEYKKNTACEGVTSKVLAKKIVDGLDNDGKIVDIAMEYGEPGYIKGEDDNAIITSDWNDIPNSVFEFLEHNGYDLEWSDEWIMDYQNSKIYRSSPDSYSWTPSYFWLGDCELLGIEDEFDTYLETLINDPSKAESTGRDLTAYGFEDIDDYCHESGWYGINEDPQEVFDEASLKWNEVVFQLCDVSQFAVHWKTWAKGEVDE